MAVTVITGRTRTVTVSGVLSGACGNQWLCDANSPVQDQRWESLVNLKAFSAFVEMWTEFSTGGTVPLDCTPAIGAQTGQVRLEARITYGGGAGTYSDSDSVSQVYNLPDGGCSFDMAGSYSFTLETRECFDIEPLDADLVDEFGFPSEGGGAFRNGYPAYKVEYYEQAKPGGQLTGSMSVAGASVAVNAAIVAPFRCSYEINQDVYALARNKTNATRATAAMNGIALGAPYHQEGVGTVIDASNGGYAQAVSTSRTDVYARILPVLFTPIPYTLNARLRAMEEQFPANLSLNWLWKAGEWLTLPFAGGEANGTVSQRAWSIGANLNGINLPREEFSEQYSALEGARSHLTGWPSVKPDDSRDWRTEWLGVPWKVGTAQHEAEVEVWAGTYSETG